MVRLRSARADLQDADYRHDEARLEVVADGQPWRFDGDRALFRLVSEAQRIRLAYLFDPVLAVHTSVVEPLPHQITAVYEAMLPRQPLRFLLADDTGAGKTIMAGLLIKELVARGDLERCLIVCPGSLAEQWQDELYRRFQLPFEILTNDKLVLPRGIPPVRRNGAATRAPPLPGDARPDGDPESRSGDRGRRARVTALRTDRVREVAGGAAW